MSRALTREERQRLEELFDLAAELPHAEQAAFVERECGSNDALRAALVHLLEGLVGDDLLSQIQPDAPTRAGTRIGAYKLLERIGEGGMGEVYAAEQTEPITRKVALKIIKPGMDSAQVVARFEAERQALARMTHPNIARVYDGGTTGDGRPYFVMEYVAGEPVTDYCDRRKLSTRERLELFLGICDGVQHAHQKGIIHRDLKPSNLLVASGDGRAVPKIIDFGVARAMTGRLAERTLHTMLGQIVGTLDYMSPEQADPTAVDVDTRSDVYSLGVVLYQLLSGLLPFEHHSAFDMPLSEIQRAIREKDPPTPSTRLRRERGTATALAPLRGTNERALIRQLAGDLDWICMKALEKDPARRYVSAVELAADVRRHLAHEPVLAGKPGALYRARKFVRRHRVSVTAGALIVAGLTAGAGGLVSSRMAVMASLQRERALAPQVDSSHARGLLAQADELWPPYPELIPRLEKWCEEARKLTAKRDGYVADLAAMRLRALPWTAEERAHDRARATGIEDLELAEEDLTHWKELIASDPSRERPFAQKVIERLESVIAGLRPEAEMRRTWSFESLLDQSSQDVLQGLVEDLVLLGDERSGLLAADDNDLLITGDDESGPASTGAGTPEHGWSIGNRLKFARQLEAGFAEGGVYAEAWREALPRIRELPVYAGLDLHVQMGLVPIGRDPQSGLWEFAHLMSGRRVARRRADGTLELTPDSGMVLVLIPGGTFWMGSQSEHPDEPNYYDPDDGQGVSIEANGADVVVLDDAQLFKVAKRFLALTYDPRIGREVGVDRTKERAIQVDVAPYFLSKYEMTQGQWEWATGENPSNLQPGFLELAPLNPVNSVTWLDCDKALRPLGLELPHEEQWEYAARAGTQTPWWTGAHETSLKGAANVFDLSCNEQIQRWARTMLIFAADFEDGSTTIDEVTGRRANPWGLHDVCGNVLEWCANHPYLYGAHAGPIPDTREFRVARGGSARMPAAQCRSAARAIGPAGFKDPALGLRPARAIEN